MRRICKLFPLVVSFSVPLGALADDRLPETAPLEKMKPDKRSKAMVEGIHDFLDRKIDEAVEERSKHWDRKHSSKEAYRKSVRDNRKRFRRIIGLIDERRAASMERFGTETDPALVSKTERFRVYQVRWPVFTGVDGEGLLLEPKQEPVGRVVVLPDAGQTPEQVAGLTDGLPAHQQLARRLAANGCQVVVPTLISRKATYSGNPDISMTNMPHREWIYRQAYEMGRHVIGYEVQKVLAAVDWFEKRASDDPTVGVAGYGEGGLLALYSAAADRRIDATLVSGYFGPRRKLWREPIYRNVWSLLKRFGDAELASLVFPRSVQVLHCSVPDVDGPPAARKGREDVAAPGRLRTPDRSTVREEVQRARRLGSNMADIEMVSTWPKEEGGSAAKAWGAAVRGLLEKLGRSGDLAGVGEKPLGDRRKSFDPEVRQKRQVRQIERHVQRKMRYSDDVRDAFFLDKVDRSSVEAFTEDAKRYKRILWEEVIGKIDQPKRPLGVRSKKVYDRKEWTGYEVRLNVWNDVFAWGVLCVPKGIEDDDVRPAVVCQHGLESLPRDTIVGSSRFYHNYAARLAKRGFVTFAPHNPYRGGDRFRLLQRKANPIKASLFSVILGQHQQILKWLKGLPYVDGKRIGFYGLSYGGKTAVRVPPLLDGYALSICSADFNDWVRKNVTTHWRGSYMFTHEWEMPEFNLGRTFNYAEMAYLMVPRPFMVERGHHDGVAPDKWVAYEYAKVRHLYDHLGIGNRTKIEFFKGRHEINAEGTFRFLHEKLDWPVKHAK